MDLCRGETAETLALTFSAAALKPRFGGAGADAVFPCRGETAAAARLIVSAAFLKLRFGGAGALAVFTLAFCLLANTTTFATCLKVASESPNFG